jgi:energy-coupling factor transporter ATP-binding protein EcfA2
LSSPVAVREVRKRFGRWSPWVLDGVDLTLEPGSTTVVVGANGSGKSTLLRIVAGLTPATSGRVERSGVSIGYAPDRLGARVRMSARVYVEHMARLRGCSPDALACLFVASIWMTWVVTNSEDAVLASITAVTVRGPTRLRVMKLVTAFLACGVLGLFATLLPVALHNHPDPATVGHVGAGFAGHLLAAAVGVGVGSLLMQSVIRRAGWAFLVAMGAFLVEILVPNCPPVRQLLVLFNDDPPRHLASGLAVCGGETAVVVAVLVGGALWVARARS